LALALAPDGRTVAALGQNFTLQVWDLVEPRLIVEFRAEPLGITALAFSPDGRTLATAAGTTSPATLEAVAVCLWDAATGRQVGKISVPYGRGAKDHYRVSALAFSPDGRALAAASTAPLGPPDAGGGPDDCHPVRVWDVSTGREVRPFPVEPGRLPASSDPRLTEGWGAGCVAFSPDGRTLAVGDVDNTVALYEVATGRVRHRLRGHDGRVRSVAYSADGRLLVSAASDLTGLVWDLTSLEAEGIQERLDKNNLDAP
ncbi:MAG TPA: hypothetical protein VKD90_04065, partial [Gemmataceae bacterium]|nr:hypothetical protein [Gemmataceae bacterium]